MNIRFQIFLRKLKRKLKKIDALINNVGIAGPTGSLEKIKSKDWENTLHVDVNSHFYFTKKTIPLLKKSKNGSIINISSTAGILGFPISLPLCCEQMGNHWCYKNFSNGAWKI